MDSNQDFQIEVIKEYGIDKILKPKNLGDGALENVTLSDLRKELDFCYNSISFKKELIDYLQDYLVDLRVGLISNQKKRIKNIKNKKSRLKKKHPNLDETKEKDWSAIDKINNYTWILQQEKYIFHYLKELSFFIRNWVSQKRIRESNKVENQLKKINAKAEIVIREMANKKRIKNIPPPKGADYLEIGSLFAKGLIYEEKGLLYFGEKTFERKVDLNREIKLNLNNKDVNFRQYVGDTLNNNGQKNFYKSKLMMKKIIEHCEREKIEITPNFLSKYHDLINMH